MTWSRITISARAAMPFSRPTSFERLARNFESFRKPRTGLPILFLCASLNRNEGRHETVNSIVRFARSKGILCQGRGSAANSAVCYVLGITSIDPVRSGLLFERFVSAERKEPPDIDVDFEHERREEVIQWIYERYGRDRVATTVPAYPGKSQNPWVALAFRPAQSRCIRHCVCRMIAARQPEAADATQSAQRTAGYPDGAA